MEPVLTDTAFDEAFKIISSDKSQANSLRQLLLKNNKNDNDLNMKIIQYLGELEYDLKTLYDILRDLKISFHDIRNSVINSNMDNNNKNKNIKKDNNKVMLKDNKAPKNNNKKEGLYLQNDFDKLEQNFNGITKTYAMTSKNSDRNDNHNISEYYINSYPRKNEYNRTLPRSISCKSYVGNWDSNSNGLDFLDNNKYNLDLNKKGNAYRNYIDDKYPNNILSNNKNIDNKFFDSNFSNGNLSKDRTLKLNFDYDAYLTDYSLNRTNKNDLNNTNGDNVNNSKKNLNLSDLNNDNNINNNIYNPNNDNIKIDENVNNDNIISNKNDNDNNNNKNNNDININENKKNLFTFGEPKNNQNINNYTVTFDPKKKPLIINENQYDDNNNNYYIENNDNNNMNNNNEDYNSIENKRNYLNNYNDNINNNKYNNKYNNNENGHIYPNNKYNNNINRGQNNLFNPDSNNRDIYLNDLNNNLNIDNNNNLDRDNIKNNYNNKENDDEDLEEQKKGIIKSILSEIFQDTNKLDLLRKLLGDDIGEQLLSGNISEENLYKVAEILNNYQLNKMGKKKGKHFTTKKFNQPSDKILLKESLDDKRYNFREFPRGWSSTKDYFVNNGSTFLKDKRKKKY